MSHHDEDNTAKGYGIFLFYGVLMFILIISTLVYVYSQSYAGL